MTATRPLLGSAAIALVGAAVLFLLGGILASTAGLLFIAAVTGAGVGLVLAGAAVDDRFSAAPLVAPWTRQAVRRVAVALAVGAVVVAAIATWLFARSEGGALGVLEYLWETFGLLVPAEVVVAALAATWGAGAGPVRGT